MRYAPYLAVLVIVAVLWGFSASRGQKAYADPSTQPSHTNSESTADQMEMSVRARAMAAEMAGYPRIGSDVEVGLNPSAAIPAPFNNNLRKTKGKLLAFDAEWVGIQAKEYDVKIWIPRENVGYVASIPGTGNP